MRTSRRLVAAGLLVTGGLLASPSAVPVYDGIGQPDEPYRYVARPAGAAATAAPTAATATTPVRAGASVNGLTLSSAENGPQVSLFLPVGALAAPGGTITVTATPRPAADPPAGTRLDGNVYVLTLTDPAGPVTVTSKAAIATLYLRATSPRQPGPVLEHRSGPGQPWTALQTSRGGQDVYVGSFAGPGQYALAFPTTAAHRSGSRLPWLLGGAVVLLGALLVVVRVRAGSRAE